VLKTLVIRDFILVEYQEITFAPGMNVITGETGTGKSLLVNALSLLLGARGKEEWIRPGSSRAVVEGCFTLQGVPELRQHLAVCGIPLEGGDFVVLSRELASGGKSKARINGRVVPLNVLRDVAVLLLDICGQREHSLFFTSSNILRLLDTFLPERGKAIKQQYVTRFEEKQALEERLSSLEQGQEKELADLEEILEEVQQSELTPELILECEEEFGRISQAQQYLEAVREFRESILGDEGVLRRISRLRALFRELSGASATLQEAEIQEILERVELELEEALRLVQGLEGFFSFSPERIESVERAVAEIERLKRKYRFLTTSEFVMFLKGLKERKSILEREIAQKDVLRERIAELSRELLFLGGELSAERWRAFEVLRERVKEELATLALQGANLDLALGKRREPGPEGIDEARLLISLNPGMPLLPVEETASGGEISRIVLALKSVASALSGTPVLVFDEIDQGVGGVTAFGVGDKLKKLARQHQVICITHLPQIASFADHHLKVEKFSTGEKAWVEVVPLSSWEERLQEIARMMGDEKKQAVTLEYAEALIRRARSGGFEIQ